jgi:hypothetical protein
MAVQTSMFPWQQLHCSREIVFSVRSMPRCYKQGKLGIAVNWLVSQSVRELLRLSRELLLLELVAEAGNSSGTQRKGSVRCWKLLPEDW